MIGLLDITPDERRVLMDVANGCLVWFPRVPKEWDRVDLEHAHHDLPVYAWRVDAHWEIADSGTMRAVRHLQGSDLLTRPVLRAKSPQSIPLSGDGKRMINAFLREGWSP